MTPAVAFWIFSVSSATIACFSDKDLCVRHTWFHLHENLRRTSVRRVRGVQKGTVPMPQRHRGQKSIIKRFCHPRQDLRSLLHLLSLERDCYYIKFRRNVKHFCKIQYRFSVSAEAASPTPPVQRNDNHLSSEHMPDERSSSPRANYKRHTHMANTHGARAELYCKVEDRSPPPAIIRSASRCSSSRRGPWWRRRRSS